MEYLIHVISAWDILSVRFTIATIIIVSVVITTKKVLGMKSISFFFQIFVSATEIG